MKKTKSSYFRAMNDVLTFDDDERMFLERLADSVFDGVMLLKDYMSKTLRAYALDIADAVTTVVIYRVYQEDGDKNISDAIAFLCQRKMLMTLVNAISYFITMHDLPDEIISKVEMVGIPLFTYARKRRAKR